WLLIINLVNQKFTAMKKISVLLVLVSSYCWAQNPNWADNVGKIIYENCASCHRTGGIAPFPLTSYQDAVDNAQSIAGAISSGVMPPWTPDPNYKSFVHQRVMSQSDKDAVLQWITNNTPSGDLRFAPSPRAYSSTSQIGIPSLTLTIPSYIVTSNTDVYRNFELPSGLTALNYVKAIEVVPGNSSIVHHVLVFADNSTNTINPNSVGGTGSSASKLLFGYTPGAQPYFTPEGTGLKLDANTRIILQIHYAPGSMGLTDATKVNFKLTTTPQREIQVNAILNHFSTMTDGPLTIPADQTRTFHEQFTMPINATLLYVFPHMHRIGRSIESYATTTGENIPFVKIPNWEFHWQDNFVFPNTVKVNTGNVLKAVAFYDNTVNNPDNPNSPPSTVSAGENTGDEMMLVFFAYMPYQTGDENLIVDKRIIPSTATTFCQGQSVELKTIQGVGYSYQWKKDGVPIANATNFNYVATQTGNYTVSITLGTNNAESDPISVVSQAAPLSTINSSTSIIPTGGSITLTGPIGTNYTYQWYLNGQPIANANGITYEATAAGDYTLEVFNGCYSVSTVKTLTNALSSISFDLKQFLIYPNPNKGTFFVKNALDASISVLNTVGQLILETRVDSNDFQMDISQKGVYFLRVTRNGFSAVEKIVIH
ncbi:MAG: T9SS C-terminal target domain-containing protein, partial [Flavobacteriaceae bacterium]|nr:T9SS C-terminal target domain-containing protein [Flavobacteriaceae bacterium]